MSSLRQQLCFLIACQPIVLQIEWQFINVKLLKRKSNMLLCHCRSASTSLSPLHIRDSGYKYMLMFCLGGGVSECVCVFSEPTKRGGSSPSLQTVIVLVSFLRAHCQCGSFVPTMELLQQRSSLLWVCMSFLSLLHFISGALVCCQRYASTANDLWMPIGLNGNLNVLSWKQLVTLFFHASRCLLAFVLSLLREWHK